MDLTKIMAISGRPGLHRMVSEGKNSIIVESLTDQKRFPVFGHEKVSALEEISVYTTGEELPLKDILRRTFDKLEQQPVEDPKGMIEKSLRELFESIVPEYDKDRVYASDIRKLFAWYNQLLALSLLEFSEENSSTEPSGEETSPGTSSPEETSGETSGEKHPDEPEQA